jgi:hypothetical protein
MPMRFRGIAPQNALTTTHLVHCMKAACLRINDMMPLAISLVVGFAESNCRSIPNWQALSNVEANERVELGFSGRIIMRGK